jgi:hypothetical protein
MKVKEIEGTPEEIGKICHEQNFSLNDYLHDKPKVSNWTFIAIGVFFLVFCCILWTVTLIETVQRIFFLSNLMLLGILTVILHLKYEKWIVTIIAGFFGLMMLSVSLNILTPKEAINTIQEKIHTKQS